MFTSDDFDYTWQGFTPYPSIDEGVMMQNRDYNGIPLLSPYAAPGIYLPFSPGSNMDREYNYMRQLYPDEASVILSEAEREADRMDYAESPIYDEYPDRETLLLAVNRIYSRVAEPITSLQSARENSEDGAPANESAHEMCPCTDTRWVIYLIQVIFYNEILRRRSKRRQWFY